MKKVVVALLTVGLSSLLLGVWGLVTSVQAAPPSPVNFTVAAGQTVTLRVNLFCLDFSKDFPTGQNLTVGPAADAKLLKALSYGVDKGYDKSDPRQLQLALWYLRDGTFHTNQGESKDKAQEIVDNANQGTTTTAAATTAAAGGPVGLADAVKAGQVTLVTTGVQPLGQGEFYGTAVLSVKNNGTASLNLTLAPGATFTANGANFQTTLGYVTGVEESAITTTAPATVSGAPATGGGATVSQSDSVLPLVLLSLTLVVFATGGWLIVREAKAARR